MSILKIDERKLGELLSKPNVQEAMEARCEVQGHEFENCCTFFLQTYQKCRWCGEAR